MRKSLLIYSLTLILFSCARPNYAPAPETPITTGQGSELSCQVQFQAGQCLHQSWEKLPTEEDFGSFQFRTFRNNADSTAKTLEDIPGLSVMLWMPGMGHGSSPITLERTEVGTYRATKVFFTMRGEWEIRFQVKAGQEIRDQAILRVQF